jgi:hypothetical protein
MISRGRAVPLIVVLLVALRAPAQQNAGQDNAQCQHKAGSTPLDHEAMMKRGEKGMGFSQTKTTHHFLLTSDGGVIAVSANDPKDSATRDQIRMHLSHVASAFSQGDFDIPMFVHDQTPSGVVEMKRLQSVIQYRYAQSDGGGKVIVSSDSAEGVGAIHEFLRFQIREHKTVTPSRSNRPVCPARMDSFFKSGSGRTSGHVPSDMNPDRYPVPAC